MYRYDSQDRILIRERARQFRDQVQRHLGGELNEDEFKGLRLRNGLYRELHAHMLRVAIPYGVMSSRQLRRLAYVARRYDRGYGHFTTRQNIQFNWPKLEQAADILDDLADADMHAIQTSGNCIRNITTDHLAGVAADEIEDPRPYCELLRRWSTLHPEFLWLPRKFKIAFSGARIDRAATAVHDIGVRLVRNMEGEIGFRILVGGGLGRKPYLGQVIREYLPKRHLLSYIEAILRVYNLQGRRDNLHKARIKILLNDLGMERFRSRVEQEWESIKKGPLLVSDVDIERMKAHFLPPPYETGLANRIIPLDGISGNALSTEYSRWLKTNTAVHKVPGYRVVYISLKQPGAAPGDASAEQMEAVAGLADRHSFGEIRASHEQNLLLAHVKESDLPAVWRGLASQDLATPNIGTLTDMICCPGLDYCSLANAASIPIARQINARFAELKQVYELGPVRIKISGCMNACGHHDVADIGILGVDKKGAEWYQITLGGAAGDEAALGTRLGPAIAKQHVAAAIERILQTYLQQRAGGESFATTFRRIGIQPFKEHVYADRQKPQADRQSLAALH